MTHVYNLYRPADHPQLRAALTLSLQGLRRTIWIGILLVRSLFSTLRCKGLSTRVLQLPFSGVQDSPPSHLS